MNVTNHSIPGASAQKRTTLVKNPETLTAGTSNPRQFDRDLARWHRPETSYVALNTRGGVISVFHGPAQSIGRAFRKDVERCARKLANPHVFPSLIEIEFSASPEDAFPAAEGLPEDYRQSSIDWALGLSSAVTIAVNSEAGGIGYEPYKILHPVQTVFRCSESNVDVWTDYLGRRLRPRQRFAIVRLDASEVWS
jgi:hypothetical protein